MREILFRGKSMDNGEWVNGSLIHAGDYCCILEDEEKLHPHCWPYLDSECGTFDGYATPVDPFTVGQFTGLYDRNGKRIFEGDILRCCLGDKIDIGVVQYDDRIAAFIVLFTDGVLTFLDFFTAKVETWYEVIGNIHDNPELLEEGEDDD